MPTKHYDYIIIGQGLAGLQLALSFNNDLFFKDKTIALIDPDNKSNNDKTWCFWEKTTNNLESIVTKSWQKALFYSSSKKINLDLKPYTYKMIRSLDFYNYTKAKLNKNTNITFIKESVVSTSNKHISATTQKNTYTATHIFDSRIPENFPLKNDTNLIQHFKGWVISTEENKFNVNEMTMMDYRLKDGNQTTFMYVLPLSNHKALIEFTYFTETKVEDLTYNSYLKKYIKDYLSIEKYTILEEEKGQIPMSTFNFKSYSTSNITKIGTGGGFVKASTGYSFKLTEKKALKITQNLKNGFAPTKQLFKSKFAFYDKIFLKVLKDYNHKGEWIFERYYGNNNIKTMFRFLDEESSFKEDLKIMSSLFSWQFIAAFFKTLGK